MAKFPTIAIHKNGFFTQVLAISSSDKFFNKEIITDLNNVPKNVSMIISDTLSKENCAKVKKTAETLRIKVLFLFDKNDSDELVSAGILDAKDVLIRESITGDIFNDILKKCQE